MQLNHPAQFLGVCGNFDKIRCHVQLLFAPCELTPALAPA
jgi:hypothetical protein